MDKCDRYNRFKIILNQFRGHCYEYFKEITRQPYRENFFYNRIVNIWNQLPSEIVEATSVNSFKADIDHWMSSGTTAHPGIKLKYKSYVHKIQILFISY